ncbi:CoA pyrophosphatase [Lutibacter sp.]|uniref:NUDIX hydrolase n=1 Tax=Lutibacter sp. TaxID=1925666 RepID=UPI003564AC3C
MDFTYFKNNLNKLNTFQLGGIDAQFKLAPKIRTKYKDEFIYANNPKKAAVLVLFYPNENNETTFLLTQRAEYNGTHASQISFPGGKFDTKDDSLEKTALRETYEEVGVEINHISIFKQMTDVYIPPSNFIVTPFLSTINFKPNFIKNHEVAELIHISLTDFLDENNVTTDVLSTSYAKNMIVPCFKLNNYVVWGATAMMLSEIKELIKKL